MYRTILVPVDGSAFAEHAVTTAAVLARKTGAKLLLARVHEIIADGSELSGVERWERDQRRQEATYLDHTASRLQAKFGIEVLKALLNEPIVPALCDCAAKNDVDLVVMSTHGRTGFSRAWLGSIADGVVRQATVPVLLLRPWEHLEEEFADGGPEAALGRIVIPLDGSLLSEQVLEHAAAVATAVSAEVTLLRVVEPVVIRGVEYPLPYPLPVPALDDEGTAREIARATEYVESLAKRLRSAHPQLEVLGEVRRGEVVAATILEVVHDQKAGLVAMTSHGRGMSRLFAGSVADKVLRGGPGAVLLYHPAHDRAALAEPTIKDSLTDARTLTA
jgi:nucleotide-binding universal stress UspA family protein